MQFEHAEHKGEELMTDVQFLEYKRVRDELEAARLRRVFSAFDKKVFLLIIKIYFGLDELCSYSPMGNDDCHYLM